MTVGFGPGITISQGVQVVNKPLTMLFDPAHIGDALALEWGNLSVYDGYPGQFCARTTARLESNRKYMFSFCVSYCTDPANLIGLANAGLDLNQYLGRDTNGAGFAQDGSLYYNGSVVGTGFPTWGTPGDCVDLAVDTVNNTMWLRVNGGFWNNNDVADPTNNTGGMPTLVSGPLYPTVCIGGFGGPTEISINSANIYSVPAGFSFIGSGFPAFVFTSGRADAADAFDGNYTTVNTSGYTLNGNADSISAYWVHIPGLDSDIVSAFSAAGMTPWSSGYMWYTNWGPGSVENPTSGISHIAYDQSSKRLYIVAFDPNSAWSTPGASGQAWSGIWQFPVVCTAIIPTIQKAGWC